MGKIIYFISVLSGVRVVNFILLVLIPIFAGFGICAFFDKSFLLHLDEREIYEKKMKITALKIFALWLIIVISIILIPNKKEMYLIALTKNYEIEDVSKMSKKEIQSTVDYIFEKMDELKNDKRGFVNDK